MFHSNEKRRGIAEFQGPYGPLQVLEGKIQLVWSLQQLSQGAWLTRSGALLRILEPGHWNRGAGPDFLEAVLEIDGERCMGSVELHLYREDWWRHGHHVDPRYNPVVLHVVLFAGGLERPVKTVSGKEPEEWIMGPWMREDLESIAGGEPGLFGEQSPELLEAIEAELPASARDRLRIGADRRWEDKESMARCLLDTYCWEEALHHMVLYYLGYPANRRSFFELAELYPLPSWREEALPHRLREYGSIAINWTAGRPANRALSRLQSYVRLNRCSPNWMADLAKLPACLRNGRSDGECPNAHRREWRDWIQKSVCCSSLGSALADRLLIDVFLPILAAGELLVSDVGRETWFQAHPVASPEAYRRILRAAGIGGRGSHALRNGWIQGLIWLDDQLRLERIRRSFPASPASKPSLTS